MPREMPREKSRDRGQPWRLVCVLFGVLNFLQRNVEKKIVIVLITELDLTVELGWFYPLRLKLAGLKLTI